MNRNVSLTLVMGLLVVGLAVAAVGSVSLAGAASHAQIPPKGTSSPGDPAGQPAASNAGKPSRVTVSTTSTGFTYQGRLTQSGSPANGQSDLQFTLFDAPTGGNQVGSQVTVISQTVSDGLFTVLLNFGPSAFQGQARWLEVGVRPGGSGGSFTTLSPRQALTPAPYAVGLVPGAAITDTSGSPILSVNNGGTGTGLYGLHSSATGTEAAIKGETNSTDPSALGVVGRVTNTSPGNNSVAVRGINEGTAGSGIGVWGSQAGGGWGVYGQTPSGVGVVGESNGGTGVVGESTGGAGVYGHSNNGTGVYGQSNSGYGGYFGSGSGYGVVGQSISNTAGYFNSGSGLGVYSHSNTYVAGFFTSGSNAIYARSDYANTIEAISSYTGTVAVQGQSSLGTGVEGVGVTGVSGTGTSGDGVRGSSSTGVGGSFTSTNYDAVQGHASSAFSGLAGFNSGTGPGVFGTSTGGGLAGRFDGNVTVNGTLNATVKNFKIDDPLDPANKYLYHTSVESSDMMNIYNGNVTLDGAGEAWVQMPAWFQALNQDFRYQLTSIGAPGPNLYIAEKVKDNRFKIAGGKPGMEVSWLVTGVRHDPYAQAHPSPVEQAKPASEQGLYQYPELYNQPASKGLNSVYSSSTGARAQPQADRPSGK